LKEKNVGESGMDLAIFSQEYDKLLILGDIVFQNPGSHRRAFHPNADSPLAKP
jgi:hypothetical protein